MADLGAVDARRSAILYISKEEFAIVRMFAGCRMRSIPHAHGLNEETQWVCCEEDKEKGSCKVPHPLTGEKQSKDMVLPYSCCKRKGKS